MESLRKIISLVHHPRFGGLPAHYPVAAAWGEPPRGFSPASAFAAARGRRPLGVYAHVPFCASRCSFCFLEVRRAAQDSRGLGEYARALLAEARAVSAAAPGPADNVYIGGGTPNLMAAGPLAELTAGLRSLFRLRRGGQVSMEANPDFFDAEKLRLLKDAGLNLILAGVQSFDPALMRRYARAQHCGRVKKAFEAMRRAGFDNINADLLCGLPGQDRKGFLADVNMIAEIRPEHVHINRYKPPDPAAGGKAPAEALRREGLELLAARGYRIMDEDSASLAPGKMNRQGDPDFQLEANIAGLGAGALSRAWGSARWLNYRAPEAYSARVLAGKPAAEKAASLGPADELAHWLMNRLLRPLQVSEAEAAEKFGRPALRAAAPRLRALEAAGVLRRVAPGVLEASPGRWFEITAGLYGERFLSALARSASRGDHAR